MIYSGFHRAGALALAVVLSAIPLRVVNSTDLQSNLAQASSGLEKIGNDICHSLKLSCKKPTKSAHKKTKVRTTTQRAPHQNPEAAKPSVKATSAPSLPESVTNKTAKPVKTPAAIPRAKPQLNVSVKKTGSATNAVPARKPDQIKPTAELPQKVAVGPATPSLVPSDRGADCLASLRNSKADFEALTSPLGGANCQVDTPVRLHAIETPSGKVGLPEAPIFNCKFARQFSLWLSDTGSAAVFAQLNTKLVKVSTGPGYECRGRNGNSSAKMSEHAFGNAVDITTFTTADGKVYQMSDARNPASPVFEVLRGLRTSACGYFSTVLGPGSNEAHAFHFHFDMGMHGKSGNYKICE